MNYVWAVLWAICWFKGSDSQASLLTSSSTAWKLKSFMTLKISHARHIGVCCLLRRNVGKLRLRSLSYSHSFFHKWMRLGLQGATLSGGRLKNSGSQRNLIVPVIPHICKIMRHLTQLNRRRITYQPHFTISHTKHTASLHTDYQLTLKVFSLPLRGPYHENVL